MATQELTPGTPGGIVVNREAEQNNLPDESVMKSNAAPGSSPLLYWTGGAGAEEDGVLHLPLHLPLLPTRHVI